MWSVAIATSGLLFVTFAIRVRRRFDTEELIAASAVSCAVLSVLIVAVGWNQHAFPFAPLLGAAVGGVSAATFAVNRSVARSSTRDSRRETVAGFLAYAVGALVGFVGGFLFALRGLGW